MEVPAVGGLRPPAIPSERIADKVIDDLGVDPKNVTRIFSERGPRSNRGAFCAKLLSEKYPNAPVTTLTDKAGDAAETDIANYYSQKAQALSSARSGKHLAVKPYSGSRRATRRADRASTSTLCRTT